MVSEKILDRIRKLLRLSEGTHSAEEAHSALLMAQRLMAEHGLSMQQVRLAKEVREEVVHGEILTTRRRDGFTQRLAWVIANNFRCIPYWYKEVAGYGRKRCRYEYTLRFIGLAEDAEIAATTFHTADAAARNLAARFVRRYGGGHEARQSYLLGWVEGLYVKFEAQRKENANLALALTTPKAVQDEAQKMTIRKGRQNTPTRNLDEQALYVGFQDGRQFGEGLEG